MDLEKRINVLEEISNSNTNIASRLKNIDLSSVSTKGNFFYYSDTIFLEYILEILDIDLEKHTERQIYEEVLEWNRKYLVDLAQNISIFTNNPVSKDKLKFLVERSIEGNLVDSLLNGENPYAKYNSVFLEELTKEGININEWIEHGKLLGYFNTPDSSSTLEIKEWKRDFRKEYAIGNISECCIAINDDRGDLKYKQVLLDYFLDLSIQVLFINKHDVGNPENRQKIGQIYYVPLLMHTEDGKKPILGVTSVEVAKKHKKDFDLVPPIANSILDSREGYCQKNCFEAAFISPRFSLFNDYLREKGRQFNGIIARLKNRKTSYNALKREATDELYRPNENENSDEKQLRAQKNLENAKNMLGTIEGDLAKTISYKENLYREYRIKVEKIGLAAAIEKRTEYFGTDYLDIFSRKDDGFFDLSKKIHNPTGHLIERDGPFYLMENHINILREKYPNKNERRRKK
jgi:hypothetical protein